MKIKEVIESYVSDWDFDNDISATRKIELDVEVSLKGNIYTLFIQATQDLYSKVTRATYLQPEEVDSKEGDFYLESVNIYKGDDLESIYESAFTDEMINEIIEKCISKQY